MLAAFDRADGDSLGHEEGLEAGLVREEAGETLEHGNG
jgi:hypothetical protein